MLIYFIWYPTDCLFIIFLLFKNWRWNISLFENGYSNSQIAISLSHFYAYKQISDKYDNGLIFEDDVILCDNFIDKLNRYRITNK